VDGSSQVLRLLPLRLSLSQLGSVSYSSLNERTKVGMVTLSAANAFRAEAAACDFSRYSPPDLLIGALPLESQAQESIGAPDRVRR